jgi:tetratricopeptide (TPR) repeat protein
VAVFEGSEPHAFWNRGHFEHRLERDAAPALARLFRESASPNDWRREAEYYFERQRYRQAGECYRRAGQAVKECEALAMFGESVGDWLGALKRWEQIGDIARQAPLLEKISRFDEALDIYRRLGHPDKVAELEIAQLERKGRWAEAGQRWESLNRHEEAARCYHKSGNRARALTLEAVRAERGKNWRGAGECWWELKSWEAAARCFRKAKDTRRAAMATATLAESQKDWASAANAFRKAGESTKAKECRVRAYEQGGKLKEAAKLCERLGDTNGALRLYRKLGDTGAIDRIEVSRVDLNDGVGQKLLTLVKREKLDLALQLASARRAIIRSLMSNRLPQAKRRELRDEDYELRMAQGQCRAMLAEKAGDWSKAAYHWKRIRFDGKARNAELRAAESLADPANRAAAFIALREWAHAIDCYKQINDVQGEKLATACLLQDKGEWAAAAEAWRDLGQFEQSERCRSRLSGYQNASQAQQSLFG